MNGWTPIEIGVVTLALEWILFLWYITSRRILRYLKSPEYIRQKINNPLPENSYYTSQNDASKNNKKPNLLGVIEHIKKDTTNHKANNENK